MDIKIIIIGLLVFLCAYLFYTRKQIDSINEKVRHQNYELENKNAALTANYEASNLLYQNIQNDIKNKQNELQSLKETVEETAAAQKELVDQAFSSYCDTLEMQYCVADKEFDDKMQDIANYIKQEQNKLDAIAATRAAAQEALLKEQEVKEEKDNYRLIPSTSDLDDIKELERVKNKLHKPRILSMLIWQTYWQPLSKVKFPVIIQAKTKMGIYKITNIQTNECYIGQSVDIYKRWSDHCKCGLGIDTPAGNKLYKSMQEYGLENFTFEVLAECPKEELDAKEKYFIKLYQAKEFGFNGNEGNK